MKPGTTEEQVLEACGRAGHMPNDIDGVQRITVGRNRAESQHGFTHALIVQLADESALAHYLDHPARKRYLTEHLDPIVAADRPGVRRPRHPTRGRAPVVLMPGFLAGDQTLLAMAAWLHRIGYRPRLCGFIANVDCSDRTVERIERKLDCLAARHRRRVALIGHSRGGHYARARRQAARPRLARDLDGSRPAGDVRLQRSDAGCRRRCASHPAARWPRPLIRMPERRLQLRFVTDFHAPFPVHAVRMTSIYSKGDGVVCWQTQLVPDADCVEVTGSHVGLAFNRKSYRAIAAALATAELPTEPNRKFHEPRRAR